MDNKELQAAVAEMMQKPEKQAFAEFITETVQPGRIIDNWVGMLLDYRSLEHGDMLVKQVRKGIRVYSHVLGSEPLKSQMTLTDRVAYTLDTAIVATWANSLDLQNGRFGTAQEIINEMQIKLREYYVNKVFTALTSVWTAANTPNNYTAASGSVTKTILDNAIARIDDTTSGAKAIVGTRDVLRPITEFAQWSTEPVGGTKALIQDVASEAAAKGYLGSYKGIPLVVAEQSYDYPDTNVARIPNDKLLVIGTKVGEFITYGAPRPQEWMNMTVVPPAWNYAIWQQFGFIIDKAEGIYVVGAIS